MVPPPLTILKLSVTEPASGSSAVRPMVSPTQISGCELTSDFVSALTAKVTELGFVQSPAGVYVIVTAVWAVGGAM